MEFGDFAFCCPCMCCVVSYIGSWPKILESIKYRAAKAVIKSKSNPARCALLRELGWQPINDFLDRQRIT